jgi:hypothetical protein
VRLAVATASAAMQYLRGSKWKPRRRRTSTARQRLLWRLSKAEQRERAKNLLIPGSTAKHPKRDPIGIYPTPLPRSEMHRLTAGLDVEGGHSDMPELEWRRLVGRRVAHNMLAYRRLAAELRDYRNMPVQELRRLVGRFIEITIPRK